MKSTIKKLVFAFLFIFIFVFLDQWTKIQAVAHLYGGRDIVLIQNVLELHYLENTGAAFSLLEDKMLLFYMLTPLLCAVMFLMYWRLPTQKKFHVLRILLLFLMSGAIGNFIDRCLYQYVIDFIYVSLIHFPVFNVADIYVTCSVAVLFVCILFYYSEDDLNQIIDSIKFWKKQVVK